MTHDNTPGDTESLRDEAREAVASGEDIAAQVRDITLKALTRRRLDTEGVRQVVRAVAEGARLGAGGHGTRAKAALQDAVSGLDSALAKGAEASRLALEEASGRLEEFSRRDLKRALSDLEGLESLFVETLSEVAQGGKDVAAGILRDLADHARGSGTAVGSEALTALGSLKDKLAAGGKEGLQAGADAALDTGSRIAQVASGLLAGIAESLKPSRSGTKSDDSPPSEG
ncbi:MAG TPA: hypothetical protein ENJ31_03430 [Anaerolineae bacterium]|nr:hypothetical protein [Anaerolineae bacterium]